MRYPTDQEILDQYKVYLAQKLKQVEYLNDLYKMNKNKNPELVTIKNKLNKIKNAKLAQWSAGKKWILWVLSGNLEKKIWEKDRYWEQNPWMIIWK